MLSNCMWLEHFILRLPTMDEYGAWLYSRTIEQLEENYKFYKKILQTLAYGQGKDTCLFMKPSCFLGTFIGHLDVLSRDLYPNGKVFPVC